MSLPKVITKFIIIMMNRYSLLLLLVQCYCYESILMTLLSVIITCCYHESLLDVIIIVSHYSINQLDRQDTIIIDFFILYVLSFYYNYTVVYYIKA